MPPESASFLHDMLGAARAIVEYTNGKTLQDFLKERSLRDAIHWNFCVIGEALSQLNKFDPPVAESITDYWKIIGLRNQLIHGYSVINTDVTWKIVTEKLPLLIQELQTLLNE